MSITIKVRDRKYTAESMQEFLDVAKRRLMKLRDVDFSEADLADLDFQALDLSFANFTEANLKNADLHRADVYAADFTDADLRGAWLPPDALGNPTFLKAATEGTRFYAGGGLIVLKGPYPVLQVDPLGSAYRSLIAFYAEQGIYVSTGCFFGTLKAFKAAVKETHGKSPIGDEYRAVIRLIEAHGRRLNELLGAAATELE